jgi:hypothetical protein
LKLQEQGVRVKALENRPAQYHIMIEDVAVQTAWRIFQLLHRQRSVGFEANPLSAADVAATLGVYGLEHDLRVDVFELVVSLDATFMERSREKGQDDDGDAECGD